MKQVYLAGPFFTREQVNLMAKLEVILRNKGLKVYSPRKHPSKFPFGSIKFRKQTFAFDVRAIRNSDIVFAIYNDQDSGTMWEIGYAFSHCKPIVVFNSKEKRVNLMISESLHAYLNSVEKVKKYDFHRLPRIPYRGKII
jgi:nucleoside deoxyribosyltransferase